MIDMVIVNSWLLYKRNAISLKWPKSEILALALFKLKVTNCLMKENNAFTETKRGRPSSLMKDAISKRGRPCQTLPDQAIWFVIGQKLKIAEKCVKIQVAVEKPMYEILFKM